MMQEWVPNGINKTIADLSYGFPDLFRIGGGIGSALYGPPDNGYGIAADILQDVSRAAGIASIFGGSAVRGTKGTPSGRSLNCKCEVYRVWGDGSGPNGSYWTTTNPNNVPNFRSAAGLPVENSGRFVSEGILIDKCKVRYGSAAPGAGGAGGLREVLVSDPARQIRLTRVSGANPPF